MNWERLRLNLSFFSQYCLTREWGSCAHPRTLYDAIVSQLAKQLVQKARGWFFLLVNWIRETGLSGKSVSRLMEMSVFNLLSRGVNQTRAGNTRPVTGCCVCLPMNTTSPFPHRFNPSQWKAQKKTPIVWPVKNKDFWHLRNGIPAYFRAASVFAVWWRTMRCRFVQIIWKRDNPKPTEIDKDCVLSFQ